MLGLQKGGSIMGGGGTCHCSSIEVSVMSNLLHVCFKSKYYFCRTFLQP